MVARTVDVTHKEPIKRSPVMTSQGSVTVCPMSLDPAAIPVRKISGVWVLGTAALPVSVTDWGQSIPSVTRGLDSVLVDLGWRVNSVTNADRAIMDSPSVAVNDVSLVISLAMCVIQSRVGVSVPPLPPDHSVVSASPTPGVMIE